MSQIQSHASQEDSQEHKCGQKREAGQGLPAVSTGDEKAGDRGGKQREFSVLETQ